MRRPPWAIEYVVILSLLSQQKESQSTSSGVRGACTAPVIWCEICQPTYSDLANTRACD
jgi:hypothetical protein